jgi:hypothetical protein
MANTSKIKDVYGDSVKPFFSKNQVWLAAVAGAAAGIAIASLLSSEKGKAMLNNIGNSATQLADQVKSNLTKEKISETYNKITSKVKDQVPSEV